MARWFTGAEVEQVYGAGAVRTWERFERHGDLDTAAVLLRPQGKALLRDASTRVACPPTAELRLLTMTDGTLVLVSDARHNPRGYDFRTQILGSEDSIAVGLDERTPIRPVGGGASPLTANPYTGFVDRFAEVFRAETEAFLDVVRGRRPSLCPGTEALEALRVAVACDRSRAEGRPVRPEEVADDA